MLIKCATPPAIMSWTLLFASETRAQEAICADSRPSWDPMLGQASWVSEMLHILTSSGVITLFIGMVLAIRFKNIWFTAVIALASFFICFFYYNAWTVADPQSVMFRSIMEGCVGPPYGGIVIILTAICVTIGWQMKSLFTQASAQGETS